MRRNEWSPSPECAGSFRVELRKATNSAKQSLASTAKKAQAQVVSAEDQARKAEAAQKFAIEPMQPEAMDDDAEADDAIAKIFKDIDADEVAWGEISAMWSEVWVWIKDLRKEAMAKETGPRRRALKELGKRSQNDVIVKLFDYGWFEDHASDLALEMLAIYQRNRSRQRLIPSGELKRFRKLYDEWTATPDVAAG